MNEFDFMNNNNEELTEGEFAQQIPLPTEEFAQQIPVFGEELSSALPNSEETTSNSSLLTPNLEEATPNSTGETTPSASRPPLPRGESTPHSSFLTPNSETPPPPPPPPAPMPISFEEWDNSYRKFADYSDLVGKQSKNSAFAVFAATVLCVVALTLSLFSAYALYHYVSTGEFPESETVTDDGSGAFTESETETQEPENQQETTRPKIDIGDGMFETLPIPDNTDNTDETVYDDGRLTTRQIAELVTPVVVGVVIYDDTERFIQPRNVASGIIMTSDGYIITNAHVVENVEMFRVILSDETSYEAEVVGLDIRTDLAVLKVDAENLPVAVFGDSDELRVGDSVVAIGSSMGMSGTVTQGIVSALDREVFNETRYAMRHIQTDAAVNPGNSGGALVNVYGQVVGIPSSKIVAPEYEGIGFAIPITDAKPIIDDLVAYGHVTGRVMLGFSGQVVDSVTAYAHDVPMGIQIISILPDTDLYNSEIRSGDILTHIDGELMHTFEDVWAKLEDYVAGDTVTLTIFRQTGARYDSEFDVDIVLEEDIG